MSMGEMHRVVQGVASDLFRRGSTASGGLNAPAYLILGKIFAQGL